MAGGSDPAECASWHPVPVHFNGTCTREHPTHSCASVKQCCFSFQVVGLHLFFSPQAQSYLGRALTVQVISDFGSGTLSQKDWLPLHCRNASIAIGLSQVKTKWALGTLSPDDFLSSSHHVLFPFCFWCAYVLTFQIDPQADPHYVWSTWCVHHPVS